ncbi:MULTISPECIES: SRPBCC family protein [Curtobacterium]|uniref:SRPBCC family protein n=1 Tax=Curtobacterium TaxID=2034 RepID=UPI000DA9C03A|nr:MULTISPECIES: SRPBCC family protein [Curtobacterium]MBF4592208.1 SRPBCC family protein [Curtobacterium flaccumfaciens]MCS0645317.1 SRPBCC family protein [Curtobacterium flaccumfaciens pv. flaccumfaciens]MCS6527331.1 SRPBCC family protein [Curtobacterium flaccumfaciens pv. flaccumfaciens]MCS6530981.1 SRPBCC family protein [Curtobacterium flaccumfaciens pv. flaccumfaciens]MCS6581650.1 SRPBCC family protein [Curtobacterium flaccumfaciens pv. beticola]
MPVVESRCVIPVEPDVAFAVSQTQGAIRKRWDPFIRRQHLMDGATVPAKGVRTYTVQRFGLAMESEYVSYHPPSNVGMKMTKGSWFFERMGGGWRFTAAEGQPGHTLAVWRYNFTCRPKWLAPIAERIGVLVLQRDIDRRILGFARGCEDPVVLAHVAAQRAA